MKNKLKDRIIDWLKSLTLAMFMGLVITLFIVPTVVSGESMYPTLKSKDYLIINKVAYKNKHPERGDIVVFNSNIPNENGGNKNLVKRIIGLPNEHLIIKNGIVYINDKKIEEPYLEELYTSGDIDIIIPEDYFFTMGDNRSISRDSRDVEVGVINKEEIIGRISVRLYPFNSVGKIS